MWGTKKNIQLKLVADEEAREAREWEKEKAKEEREKEKEKEREKDPEGRDVDIDIDWDVSFEPGPMLTNWLVVRKRQWLRRWWAFRGQRFASFE